MDGNWVVNKNAIPFCAIGADHGLEQVNKMMKVSGGFHWHYTKHTIKQFCDPFANEYDQVVNMVTKAVISETSRTSSREMPLDMNCL